MSRIVLNDDMGNINGWLLLKNAIILQAVTDYEKALKGKNVEHKRPQHVIEDTERWFKSQDYEGLTNIDGIAVIKQCRENVIKWYEDDIEKMEKQIKKNRKQIEKIKAMKEP